MDIIFLTYATKLLDFTTTNDNILPHPQTHVVMSGNGCVR